MVVVDRNHYYYPTYKTFSNVQGEIKVNRVALINRMQLKKLSEHNADRPEPLKAEVTQTGWKSLNKRIGKRN